MQAVREHVIRRTLVAACLACLVTPLASAREAWENDWVEVHSPHFIIESAISEKQTIALAVDLENFRSAAELLTNIGRFEERIPTRIYLLRHGDKELGIDTKKIAGYFHPGMRENFALLVSSGSYNDEILKHEYVHFLVHNRDNQIYPTWFDEGFAEFLSTLRVNGTTIIDGDVPAARAGWLNTRNWMPFPKLLEVRDTTALDRNNGAMYYAQAWFLMHYLMLGRPGTNVGDESREFLRLSEGGTPPGEAFKAGFGIDPAELEAELRRYAPKLRVIHIKLREPFPPVATTSRPLRIDEIAAALGWVAFERSGHAAAQKYFDAALAANPENAMALVGTGDCHKFSGRFVQAKPFYEKAIALEPGNANHELDYAEYFLDLAQQEADPDQVRADLVEARRHFARSYKLNPGNPETLAMNGASYLFGGEDPAKAVASLEAAYELLPSEVNVRMLLAQAYIAADEKDAARKQLQQLLAWSHPGNAEGLRKLLDSIDATGGAVVDDGGQSRD